MQIICPASPARPLLRFAALAQPGMINGIIVVEMDARWTPPAGGPLVTRATARERAALLRRSPARPGRAARRERAQPAQQVHQAGRPGRPVRPSPAAAGVPALAVASTGRLPRPLPPGHVRSCGRAALHAMPATATAAARIVVQARSVGP
jgi:hypothetical protein